MAIEFIDKVTLVLKLIVEDLLFFLVKSYIKLVLYYTSEIGYCEIDLCNIEYKLYLVGTKV